MHELGIMSSAIAAVLAEVRQRGASRVHRVVLRVGVLSGVEPEALRFAFAAVAPGTAVAAAALEIDLIPGRARCRACRVEFDAGPGFVTECPYCRELSGDLRQGRELELTRIEMS